MKVTCSDCSEEEELVVDDLDDVDREVCRCGYNFVVLSVAESDPVHAQPGKLGELSPQRPLDQAA